jgi:hypothetical protein
MRACFAARTSRINATGGWRQNICTRNGPMSGSNTSEDPKPNPSPCGSRFGFAGFYQRGVAPEIFEVVEFAHVAAHDVDDHVEIIQDHPGGVDGAVGSARALVVLFFEILLDFIDNGAEVRLAGAGADNEVISDAGDLAEVEDDNVFCLFVVRQFAAEQSQFSGVHSFYLSRPKMPEFQER